MQWYDLPSLQDAIGFCFAVSRRRAERRRLAAQNDKVAGGGFVYVDAVPGAFFGMRSSFLVDNGYLDESTFLYGEERILGKQVELAGLREALVCDATYVHDHARGRFSSVDTFERDHRSIVLYFERFRLAGPVGLALLRLCTALGSAEYRIACSIHGFLNRDPAAKEPCGGAA